MALVLLCSLGMSVLGAGQGNLTAEGLSMGSTAIRFEPTTIQSEFRGVIELEGDLVMEEKREGFVAAGPAWGIGVTDGMTFETRLWILFEAAGELGDGEILALRGGISIYSTEVDMATMALGAGPGTFLARLDRSGTSFRIVGTVDSTAHGVPVPPDDPTTMQVDGGGSFTFDGDTSSWDEAASLSPPWDVALWPPDLHAQFLHLLGDDHSDPEVFESDPHQTP